MACGSGAFLVQACRYLAERLVESWETAEKTASRRSSASLRLATAPPGKLGEMLIPKDTDERMIYARRIVAQRCLYGVDKNPLAAEMAKLSLWLLTLQKDKPFTFLDHAIRSGDSLVGIANTHQLTSFSLDGNGPDMPMFTDAIKKRLDAVRLLRRQISELADNSAEDVEKKTLMLQNAEQQTQRLAYAANLLLATCWESTSETDRDERLKQALVDVEYAFKDLPVEQLEAEGKQRLQEVGCPKPFHWPLEFPEVFMQRGGFDAIVGNPPFMGGKIISTSCGPGYALWLRSYFEDAKNTADLCAYFFQRAFYLLRTTGCFGLLATNTLGQGDTADAALRVPIDSGATLFRAVSSFHWPGQAHVFAAMAVLCRGPFVGERNLDDTAVEDISYRLAVEDDASDVYGLVNQPIIAYVGSFVRGDGFILSKAGAKALVAKSPHTSEIIFPYLNGEDLNSHFQCEAKRCIINFFDRPIEDARRYEDAFNIILEKVYPFRQTVKEKAARDRWWQYAGLKRELYEAVRTLRMVLVRARVSDTHAIALVSARQVFADQIVVFSTDAWDMFAVLQSSLHEAWARHYGSTLKSDQRYSPTDCFDTFPFPSNPASHGKRGDMYLGTVARSCSPGRKG